jgi:YD repeat-containing protein
MTTVVSPVQTQAAEVYSYNAMGHLIDNSQCTPQNCGSSTAFPVTYTYDLLGDELTGTNGLGTTLTYAYNRAARLTGVTSSLSDANHPGTLLPGVHYNAFGGPTASTLGTTPTNTVNTFGYAPR